MSRKKLTAAELWSAMHDANDAMTAITKYQTFLATGREIQRVTMPE